MNQSNRTDVNQEKERYYDLVMQEARLRHELSELQKKVGDKKHTQPRQGNRIVR